MRKNDCYISFFGIVLASAAPHTLKSRPREKLQFLRPPFLRHYLFRSRCSLIYPRINALLIRFQEFLLKRTAGLSAIARAGPGKVLADPDARGYALAVLDELNFSTPVAFKHKEKGAAAAAMSLLAPSALQVIR